MKGDHFPSHAPELTVGQISYNICGELFNSQVDDMNNTRQSVVTF